MHPCLTPTAVAVLMLWSGLPAPQPPDPVATVQAFHAAQAARDTAAALLLLAEDVVIFESGGVERSRSEYERHHLGADMAFAAAVRREVVRQTHEVHGDVAIVLTETRAAGTFRERSVNSRGVETAVLRRTADGWRIVHIHWSSRRTDVP